MSIYIFFLSRNLIERETHKDGSQLVSNNLEFNTKISRRFDQQIAPIIGCESYDRENTTRSSRLIQVATKIECEFACTIDLLGKFD